MVDPCESMTILAQVDPVTFGQSMYLLLGACIWVPLLVLAVVGVWTLIKYLWWRTAKARDDHKLKANKNRPDGQPYPPAAEGVCDACQLVLKKVYYLPSGRRLCPTCYELSDER